MQIYLIANIILFLFQSVVFAQTGNSTITINALGNQAGGSALSEVMISKFRSSNTNKILNAKIYNGSPYLTDNFVLTDLFYDDKSVGKIYYRFNAYNEEIEIKNSLNPDEEINALSKNKKIALIVNGHKMSFRTYNTAENRTVNGYLITLKEGVHYNLYKKILVKYTPGSPSKNSFVKEVPPRFTKFSKFYIQNIEKNTRVEISSKKRIFYELLNDSDKSKAKMFLKEKNLHVKNEADLVQIFEYLNEASS